MARFILDLSELTNHPKLLAHVYSKLYNNKILSIILRFTIAKLFWNVQIQHRHFIVLLRHRNFYLHIACRVPSKYVSQVFITCENNCKQLTCKEANVGAMGKRVMFTSLLISWFFCRIKILIMGWNLKHHGSDNCCCLEENFRIIPAAHG